MAHDIGHFCRYHQQHRKNSRFSSFFDHPVICENGKPEISMYYNSTKSGVDTFNQMRSYPSCNPITKRWPLTVFMVFWIQPWSILKLSPALRDLEPGHLFQSALNWPSNGKVQHVKWRHPFVPSAQQLISSSDSNTSATRWADHRWNVEWLDNTTRRRNFITDKSNHSLRIALTKLHRTGFDRIGTGSERFQFCLQIWENYNLSGGVALNVQFTTNWMCGNNNTIHICGANKQQ